MSEYKVSEALSFQKLAYFLLLSFCLFYAFNMLKMNAGKTMRTDWHLPHCNRHLFADWSCWP